MRAGNCPFFLTFYKKYDILIIELNERRIHMSDSLLKCKHCKYARKAENSKYVGCAAAVRQDNVDW